MKRTFKIVSLALACFVAVLCLRALTGNRQDYVQVPPTAGHRDYIEGRRRTRFHFLLLSDRRGVVFDVFIRQLPPEKAPGPLWSEETQHWLRLHAERTAAAYARYVGFEKGIEHRHGQYLNDPLYFYGVDHYFAVPHVLLIFLFALPALWPLRHHLRRRADAHNYGQANHATALGPRFSVSDRRGGS